jgi:hypothetical protein
MRLLPFLRSRRYKQGLLSPCISNIHHCK